MQALEDAICYRSGVIAAPCADCDIDSAERCDQHACDLTLIRNYRQSIEALGLGRRVPSTMITR